MLTKHFSERSRVCKSVPSVKVKYKKDELKGNDVQRNVADSDVLSPGL